MAPPPRCEGLLDEWKRLWTASGVDSVQRGRGDRGVAAEEPGTGGGQRLTISQPAGHIEGFPARPPSGRGGVGRVRPRRRPRLRRCGTARARHPGADRQPGRSTWAVHRPTTPCHDDRARAGHGPRQARGAVCSTARKQARAEALRRAELDTYVHLADVIGTCSRILDMLVLASSREFANRRVAILPKRSEKSTGKSLKFVFRWSIGGACHRKLKQWRILATGYRGRLNELPYVTATAAALEFFIVAF